MDCPECGTPLVTYRLADREAPVCEHCGHVGIEAEHRAARARVESWSDALNRFYGTADTDADVTVPVRAADWAESPRQRVETWTEALERFYRGPSDATESGRAHAADDEADEAATSPTPAPVTFDGQSAVRPSDATE